MKAQQTHQIVVLLNENVEQHAVLMDAWLLGVNNGWGPEQTVGALAKQAQTPAWLGSDSNPLFWAEAYTYTGPYAQATTFATDLQPAYSNALIYRFKRHLTTDEVQDLFVRATSFVSALHKHTKTHSLAVTGFRSLALTTRVDVDETVLL